MVIKRNSIAPVRIITAAIIGACLHSPAATAAASGEEAEEVDVAYILDGMRAERERLVRGVYRVAGTYADEITESQQFTGGKTLRKGRVEILGAFDHVAGVMRFDRALPAWSLPSGPLRSATRRAGLEKPPEETKFVFSRRQGESCHYFSLANRLEIWPPDVIEPSSMSLAGGWMDVRAIGLYNLDQLFKGTSLNDILERRFTQTRPTARRQRNGQYLVTWQLSAFERWRCWIAPEQGFAPVRFVGQFRLPELGETQWREPHLRREVEWQEISGVWAPRSYRDLYAKELPPKTPPQPPDYRYKATYQVSEHVWNFDWESINKPINEELLDPEHLDVPNGTKVFDNRSNQPVYLYTVGDPRRPMDLAALASQTLSSGARVTLLVVNIGLILLISTSIVIRRRRGGAAE